MGKKKYNLARIGLNYIGANESLRKIDFRYRIKICVRNLNID